MEKQKVLIIGPEIFSRQTMSAIINTIGESNVVIVEPGQYQTVEDEFDLSKIKESKSKLFELKAHPSFEYAEYKSGKEKRREKRRERRKKRK